MKKSKVVMTMAIAIIAIVAVCSVSFAAWSITTGSSENISVGIVSPVVLTAEYDKDTAAAGKVLKPSDETLVDNINAVAELKTGTVTTSIANKQEGSELKVYAYAVATVGDVANTALVIKIGANQLTFDKASAVIIGEVTAADVMVSLPANADKATYAGKTITITIHFLVK